ncbi:MAG: acyl-CoA dehydrogenase, partial [Actinobacteria bacterium]|nr:acyl-CoA dehydrogenase [Actinomycetota bacterium]
MSHYRANLRDIEFNLFEVFGAGDRLGTAPFTVDAETARDALGEIERLAVGPLAESYLSSDRNPPVYDPATCTVTMPEDFKKSFRALMDSEWWRLD